MRAFFGGRGAGRYGRLTLQLESYVSALVSKSRITAEVISVLNLNSIMRIAQVSPLYESVPPKAYGGTERIVSYLTEALVELSHEVTLFASGDSRTRAELVSCADQALRGDKRVVDGMPHHLLMMERVRQAEDEFDIVHFHLDYLALPLMRQMARPAVVTFHGRLDLYDMAAMFREFQDVPVCSISDAQREPVPWMNWAATVYHGLPLDQ